jgi:hypothetical protein
VLCMIENDNFKIKTCGAEEQPIQLLDIWLRS